MLFLTCGCLNRVIFFNPFLLFFRGETRDCKGMDMRCNAIADRLHENKTKLPLVHTEFAGQRSKGRKTQTNKTEKQRRAGTSSIDWIPGSWVAGVQLKPSLLASFIIIPTRSFFYRLPPPSALSFYATISWTLLPSSWAEERTVGSWRHG
ncbi:hypothetical protein V8C44DRAFT_193849 [Trichoderma aethiopicum]